MGKLKYKRRIKILREKIGRRRSGTKKYWLYRTWQNGLRDHKKSLEE